MVATLEPSKDAPAAPPSKSETAKSYYLENSQNVQYYGSLYLGSGKEKHDFIFDTGSPWLWVATTGCIVGNQNRCHN